MAEIIQIKRGTQTSWDTANPILELAEIGLIINSNGSFTGELYIGDGINSISNLPKFSFTDGLIQEATPTILGLVRKAESINESGTDKVLNIDVLKQQLNLKDDFQTGTKIYRETYTNISNLDARVISGAGLLKNNIVYITLDVDPITVTEKVLIIQRPESNTGRVITIIIKNDIRNYINGTNTFKIRDSFGRPINGTTNDYELKTLYDWVKLIYDINTDSWEVIDTYESRIGNLIELSTTNKNNIVQSINELFTLVESAITGNVSFPPIPYDASGNTLPTQGNGTGGAILANDRWVITIGGNITNLIPQSQVEPGDIIIALVDNATNPATDFTVIDSNKEKSTSAQMVSLTNDTTYVTPLKFREGFRTLINDPKLALLNTLVNGETYLYSGNMDLSSAGNISWENGQSRFEYSDGLFRFTDFSTNTVINIGGGNVQLSSTNGGSRKYIEIDNFTQEIRLITRNSLNQIISGIIVSDTQVRTATNNFQFSNRDIVDYENLLLRLTFHPVLSGSNSFDFNNSSQFFQIIHSDASIRFFHDRNITYFQAIGPTSLNNANIQVGNALANGEAVVRLNVNKGSGINTSIILTENNGIEIEDSSNIGLIGKGDYRASYTTLSYVQKIYIDVLLGNLANLNTVNKTNIVNAINEVFLLAQAGGNSGISYPPIPYNASTNTLPTTGNGTGGSIQRNDRWYITNAGSISGITPSENLEVGDLLIALIDNATNGSHFISVDGNKDKTTTTQALAGIDDVGYLTALKNEQHFQNKINNSLLPILQGTQESFTTALKGQIDALGLLAFKDFIFLSDLNSDILVRTRPDYTATGTTNITAPNDTNGNITISFGNSDTLNRTVNLQTSINQLLISNILTGINYYLTINNSDIANTIGSIQYSGSIVVFEDNLNITNIRTTSRIVLRLVRLNSRIYIKRLSPSAPTRIESLFISETTRFLEFSNLSYRRFRITLNSNTTLTFFEAEFRESYKIFLIVTTATRSITWPSSVRMPESTNNITGASWDATNRILVLPVGTYELGGDYEGNFDYIKITDRYAEPI